MSYVLGSLNPQSVFKNFEDLTRIPRESGNEKAVSDFLMEFAKKNNLEAIQEDCLNVIIKKPATPGYENAPTVILQGHMDMVCVKDENSSHDFTKDAIPLVVDGDYVRTKGTTLGADNGIAVAMSMAVLEATDLQHPALEMFVTVAEETGMDGASGLNPENLKGTMLINIDSEEEGHILASCAGGVDAYIILPIEWAASSREKAFELHLKGMLGGHSGMEINKSRANAIKLLGRVLRKLEAVDHEVASVSGGEKMNAIAKLAKAVVQVKAENYDAAVAAIREIEAVFQNEFQTADPGIKIEIKEVPASEKVLSEKTRKAITSILRLWPNDVQSMSQNIEGLVESSNNAGVLVMDEKEIRLNGAVRSAVKTRKLEIVDRIQLIAEANGATTKLVADYPAWEYKVDSKLRDLMVSKYKEVTGNDMHVGAIHAGLECGLLTDKLGAIDMVSIGPNLYDVHTPQEHMSISSVERVYKYLVEVLKAIK